MGLSSRATVTPAKAGVHTDSAWMPAFAGMTGKPVQPLPPFRHDLSPDAARKARELGNGAAVLGTHRHIVDARAADQGALAGFGDQHVALASRLEEDDRGLGG